MPKAALSNAARRKVRKTQARPAKAPARTVTQATVVAKAAEVGADRDGLEWLIARGRLTPQQKREAEAYRQDYHDAAEDGVTLKSGLDFQEGHSGKVPQGHVGMIIRKEGAQIRLAKKRFDVLRGQVDVIEVLDGVCGRRLTLRALAGGSGHLALSYEMLFKAALDMLANAGVR